MLDCEKSRKGNAPMLTPEISTDPHSSPARQAEPLEAESSVTAVKVYTRHNRRLLKARAVRLGKMQLHEVAVHLSGRKIQTGQRQNS